MSSFRSVIYASCCFFLVGCAAGQQKSNMEEFESAYVSGAYLEAALDSEKKIKIKEGETYDPDKLLQHLEAAEAYRLAGFDEQSLLHFDAAEDAIKEWETRALGTKIGEGAGSLLLNDSVRDYQPGSMEGILSNAYKAITYMSMGNAELARVEFNRADERHRRAVEINQKVIKETQADIQKKKNESANVSTTLESSKTNDVISSKYAEMDRWQAYPEFVNPAVVYLQSLFLMGESVDQADTEKAVTFMERAAGMAPENTFLQTDLQLFNQIASGNRTGEKRIWVVHETGLGPLLVEQRIDLPIYTGRNWVVASMALPKIETRQAQVGYLNIVSNGISYQTQEFASMDRVVQTQFKKRFPGIVSRAVASAVLKTVAQDQAAKQNVWAGLAMSIFSMTSTAADVRVWRAMPKYYSVARLPYPSDGRLQIVGESIGPILNTELPDADAILIYVKTPTASAQPYVSIIPYHFNGDWGRWGHKSSESLNVSDSHLAVGAMDSEPVTQYASYISKDYQIQKEDVAVHKDIFNSIEISSVDKSLSPDGVRIIQISGRSDSDFTRYIEYRPTWFDADGIKIDSILSRWAKVKVLAGEHFSIKMVAPGIRAGNALIELRKGVE